MGRTLAQKVWDDHVVRRAEGEPDLLYIDLHLTHEVTSPQAFDGLRAAGRPVRRKDLTIATEDHNVPTTDIDKPIVDPISRAQIDALRINTKEFGIENYELGNKEQGIVHIIAPQSGLTQPGMTIVCGDSHTSTHGAFGSIAFGIGTSQVADILATQTLALSRPKVRRIEVTGKLRPGVYAKDVILHIIRKLGVQGGVGYAYEYAGEVFDRMTMEERMTVCNMSIEGGARCGYINPDQTTVDYIQGRPFAPQGADFARAAAWWLSLASPKDAEFDDQITFDGNLIEPTVTWGINPAQSVGINELLPALATFTTDDQKGVRDAFEYMDLKEQQPIRGVKIDVAFIGSCTNGRISDLREAAAIAKGRHVATGVKALVVPGSQLVREQAMAEGLDKIFEAAGFQWREAGCSMCLAMNPDKLKGREVCASSSNRNFKGRQGSPTGRTLLMSPAMVAAAAIAGCVSDVRELN